MGDFPRGNSQAPLPAGAGTPTQGGSASCLGHLLHPWWLLGVPSVPGQDLMCLASGWEQLWALSVWHRTARGHPLSPASPGASRDIKWYPRKRECGCFNDLAAVRAWCGGN